MPLRELEVFGDTRKNLRIIANRGLNGIDGVLSTALGVASTGPTTLIIGDVAFAHDVSALAAIRRNPGAFDLDIVVVNNGGGAIFDYLPLAGLAFDAFEKHFRTEVDMDIESVAAAFGIAYACPEDAQDLAASLSHRDGIRIIEVRTDAEFSRKKHREWLERELDLVSLRDPVPMRVSAAEKIVLLHGFTGSPHDFDELADLLPETEALNLLGHAGGLTPEDSEAYDFEAYFDDLERQLDLAGIERAHLVGYSMGGRLAVGFSIERPERVASLVTIGANAGIVDGWERKERRAKDEDLASRILEDGLARFVDHWMQHPILSATIERRGADWARISRERRLEGTAHGYANALRGAGQGAQPNYWQRLDEINVPSFFIAGKQDPKYSAIAESLAAEVGDGRFVLIDDAGHAAHHDDAAAVAAALNTFWKEIA